MTKRKTDGRDENVAHFRADSRIFRLNGDWYFSSREGEHGPWQSEREALRELETYVMLSGPPQDADTIEFVKESPRKRPDPKVWDRLNDLN